MLQGLASFGSSGSAAKLGSGILGNLFSFGLNRSSASKAWQRQKKFLKLQQDWSERMSSTAWQRGVKDMRAAGINPLLAVSQGGASTPSASGGTVQQTARQDMMDILGMRQIIAATSLTNAQEATERNRQRLVEKQADAISGIGEIGTMVEEFLKGIKDSMGGKGSIQTSTSSAAKGISEASGRVGEFIKDTFSPDRTGKINDEFYRWLDVKGSTREKADWFWKQDIMTQRRLRARYIREQSR